MTKNLLVRCEQPRNRTYKTLRAFVSRDEATIGLSTEDEARTILLGVSDNGPQMTSASTRGVPRAVCDRPAVRRPGAPN